MTAYTVQYWTVYAVIGCKLKQNANEGSNSCASVAGLVLCFIAYFILLVIAPLIFSVLCFTAYCWPDPDEKRQATLHVAEYLENCYRYYIEYVYLFQI